MGHGRHSRSKTGVQNAYVPGPRPSTKARALAMWTPGIYAGRDVCRLFGRQFLGLGDPAADAAGQTDLFANVVRGLLVQFGELLIMEDAEVVELLLDGRRDAGELLEIVRLAARTGQRLVADVFRLRRRGHRFRNRLFGRAEVDAEFALRARNAVDGG